jgi:signal-transduction protein with cAMP-binding, CBS, and nucleotidyltransferase domain
MMSANSKSDEKRVRIEEIMSKRLVTLDADSTALDAARAMSKNTISSIILTDMDKTVGIVTERDLIKHVCAKDLLSSKTPLSAIMSTIPLITINKDLFVEEAARTMIKNKVRHLAVEENTTHRIIGIISSTDLTRFLVDKLKLDYHISSLIKDLYSQEEPIEELDIF